MELAERTTLPNNAKSVGETANMPGEIDVADDQSAKTYLTGWRRHVVVVGFWLALFLSAVETTIVSTALVSVTNSLGGFDIRDWVVTAYLLAYTGMSGFLTIYAKLGDILGRKTVFMTAIGSFTLSAILCGISRNMTELIVFRVFQGFGASGMYSMTLVIGPTLVPPSEFPKYIGIISTVFTLASIVGPLMGGAITESGQWKWIFLFNAPAGVLSLSIIGFILPASPSDYSTFSIWEISRRKLSRSNLRRIDGLGVAMMLAWSALLVYAFESAGNYNSWGSVTIIVTMAGGAVVFTAFVAWECWLQQSQNNTVEPIFPPRILKSRVMASMFAASFFLGFPFTSVVINYPQRAQAVYGFSAQHAGITLLPLLLASSFATLSSGFLTSTWRIPPVYVIVAGAVTQIVGIGLTCSLPTDTLTFPSQQYGFEVLMGIGFGLTLSTFFTLAQITTPKNDLPVTMGAITQVRVLGGTFGLAICATVVNGHAKSKLASIMTPDEMQAISNSFSAINSLTQDQQRDVRVAFAEGFNEQNIVLTAFSIAALISCLLLWEKHPRRVEKSSS